MESLPNGLVTTSARILSYLEDPSLVDAGDIAQLWKVYHTNPSIHDHDAGHRLANFFWRVWGNDRLRNSLHGSTLAKFYTDISESQAVAPALLPLKRMTTESLISMDHIDTNTSNDPLPTPPPEIHSALPPTPNSNDNGTGSRDPLPPILKKPNSTHNHTGDSSQKKARLLLTGLGGHSITRKPSNPLTPVSPPPFAVSGGGEGGGGDTATTTTRPQQHQHHYQKRPYFVAGKAGKRRPVLARQKSSQTSVPSLLKSEVRVDSTPEQEKVAKGHAVDGLGQSRGVEKMDIPSIHEHQVSQESAERKLPEIHISPAEQEDHQNAKQDAPTNPIDLQSPSEDPTPEPETPNTNPTTSTKTQLPPDFVSGLKLLLTHKTTKTNPKTRPRYTFPCSSVHRHGDLNHLKTTSYVHPAPTKLVDDHFRVRFAEELQREEMLLNALNSLPEDERNAILDRYTQSSMGQSAPERCNRPKTAWVVVPDDEQDNVQEGGDDSPDSNDDDDWVSAADAAGGWMADDAQDYFPNTNLDAISFKFEGMSYTSSSRAASRLRAPGQLTVLFRAEQYGYQAEAGLVDGA